MAEFKNLIVTKQGLHLIELANVTQKPLIYTHLDIGDKVPADESSIPFMESILNKRLTGKITQLNMISNADTLEARYSITGTYTNETIDTGFFMSEVGLYAKVESNSYEDTVWEGYNGEEVLFGYAYAPDGKSDWMPDKTVPIDTLEIGIYISISNSVHVSVYINKEDNLKVSTFNLHVRDNNIQFKDLEKKLDDGDFALNQRADSLGTDLSALTKKVNNHLVDVNAHKDFTGCTNTKDGERGFVPKPLKSNANHFLSSDGKWKSILDEKFVFKGSTSSSDGFVGLVPAPTRGQVGEYYLNSAGKWKPVVQRSIKEVINIVYPVGSVIISANGDDPNVRWSGTRWEKFAAGKVLMGEGTYTEKGTAYTYNVGDTGGEVKHINTVSEIPPHNHPHSMGDAGSHTHSVSGTSGSAGAHTHRVSGTSGSAGAHTHGVSGNTGSTGDHSHTRGSMNITGTFGTGGDTPSLYRDDTSGAFSNVGTNGNRWASGKTDDDRTSMVAFDASTNWTGNTSVTGAHTHTINITSGSAGSHTHNISFTSGSAGNHSHSISFTSGSNGNHKHSLTIGNTGGGQAHENRQPYVVVTYWKRVA